MGGPAPGSLHPRVIATSSSPALTAHERAVRTCVGCRGKASRSELVRLVRGGDTRVVVDAARSAPGRGGWLHPSRGCLDLALRRGGVSRALRMQGPVDTTAVTDWFDQHVATSARTSASARTSSDETRAG